MVARVARVGDDRWLADGDARPALSVGAALVRDGDGPAEVLRRDEAMDAAKATSLSRRAALRRVA